MDRGISKTTSRALVVLALLLFLYYSQKSPGIESSFDRPNDKSASLSPANRPSSLIFCSQNLERFGEKFGTKEHAKDATALAERIANADCDIVALQEIFGPPASAKLVLEEFAKHLLSLTRRKFFYAFDDAPNAKLRNGFLIVKSIGTIRATYPLERDVLPRLSFRGPGRRLLRAAFAAELSVTSAEGRVWEFLLASIHLKSKSQGWKDPSGTDYELSRMAEAELIRTQLLSRSSEKTVLIMGDRNSNQQSASAEILSGRRELRDFRDSGGCRVNTKEEPICGPDSARKEKFLGALSLYTKERLRRKPRGSYRYKGNEQLIDEIYLPVGALRALRDESDNLRAGFEGDFQRGSDHKLIWVEFSLD